MIEISGLTVIYPDKTKAIESLSLRIEKGENIALCGANGAGKTTLMLALVGVLPAEKGSIAIDGVGLNKKTTNDIRSRVGFLFQNPDDQLFMPSVYDDIAFGPRNYGVPEDEIRERVDEILSELDSVHLRDKSTLKLSGGEKRVAAIAAVLASKPEAMLFDEPTAFLDLKARRTLIELIKKLPHTKIIASHDLAFLSETCERAVLLKEGKIFADGEIKKIFCDSKIMDECDLEALNI